MPHESGKTAGLVDVIEDGVSGVLFPEGDINALWPTARRLASPTLGRVEVICTP